MQFMPYQPSSRTQPVLASHEPPSLATIRLQEPAPEEEQDSRLKFTVMLQATESSQSSNASQEDPLLGSNQSPELAQEEQDSSLEIPVVPQATESSQSSIARHEDPLLASNQSPELTIEEEQEFSLEFPVVPQTTESCQSSKARHKDPLFASDQSLKLALNENQESGRVSLTRPFISSGKSRQLRALKNNRGQLFSSIPKEYVRQSKIKGQRGRAMLYCRNARGHGKTGRLLLLWILCILGIAQALTDCQILNDWLPKKFNEASCCEESGITCAAGRITKMYVA
jgi:hypothetical protein